VVSARQVLARLGLGGAPRVYPTEVVTIDLPGEGPVRFARWQHPRETSKTLDQAVIDHLRTFLAPGDVAIDVGAHTGDTTVPLALVVGAGGLVLALEPNPYVFGCLRQNASLNMDRARIEALPWAATREDGPVVFHYSDAGYCNGGRHDGVAWWRHAHGFALTVDGRNLQRYLDARPELAGRIRYVKVDAEGHDLAVLETLSDLVARERPFLRAEVYRHSPAPVRRALIGFFQARGYDVHRVAHEAALRGPPVARADDVLHGHCDLFAVPVP
jgi:FkbM family methyltransferase